MAPLPKRKRSKSSKGHHKSHQTMFPANLSGCPNCGSPRPSHRVCPSCGYYDGRQIVKKDVAEA